MPFRFGGSLPNNKAKAPYKGLLDAEALPNGAAQAMFEGLLGAQAGRMMQAAPHGDTYENLGQGNDDGVTGFVVTQEDDGQIPGHEAPKRQRASGQQAAQESGKVANHPAYWGGRTRGRSWDNNSHDLSLEGKEEETRRFFHRFPS